MHPSSKFRSFLRFRSVRIAGTTLLLILGVGLNEFISYFYYRHSPWVFRYQEDISHPLHESDRTIGYRPIANTQSRWKVIHNGNPVYDVTYRTDSFHRRIVPISVAHPPQHILFFGCSFTFGHGVEDDETIPYYTAQQLTGFRPYNYSFFGYGAQQMFTHLSERDLTREVPENRGVGIYIFMDEHVRRTATSLYNRLEHPAETPYYTIEGKKIIRTDFAEEHPILERTYRIIGKSYFTKVLMYYGWDFTPASLQTQLELIVRLVEESKNLYQRQFSGDFYVVFYPGSRYSKTLIPLLKSREVQSLDYSRLFDPADPKFHLPQGEAHPSPVANRVFAERLAKDIEDRRISLTRVP